MNALQLFLGYQKHIIRIKIYQWMRINMLRTKMSIGEGCYIGKDFVSGKNNYIRNYVKIKQGVKLGDNVTIGQYATLSRIEIGNNTHIESGVKITGNGKGRILVGDESYIGINNVLDWSENITIGNHVHIAGPSTSLWTHSSAKQAHAGMPLNDKNIEFRPVAPIVIEDNVYIGGNCTVYPGVVVGHHSIVAPNSAVSKNVEPYKMVGGVPAKTIRTLD